MKPHVYILFLLVFFLITPGCNNDDDFFDPLDDTPIREFITFGDGLNNYIWDVDFGKIVYIPGDSPTQQDEDDFAFMIRETYLQKEYCDVIYEILQKFSIKTIDGAVYTDKNSLYTDKEEEEEDITITKGTSLYTLNVNLYYGWVDTSQIIEKLKATLEFNPLAKRWILRAYRGAASDTLWMLQEGAVVGNVWYTTMQRDDDGTIYKTNFMVTANSVPANVLMSMSGQDNSGAITQGTLYSNGITTANDEWAEFGIFEITPDYNLTQ